MSKRILVVEDQLDNRQIIRDMLAPTDYEITEAENGEEALAISNCRSWTVTKRRAASRRTLRCDQSRSSQSRLMRSVAKDRRREWPAAMITFRSPSAHVSYLRKSGNSAWHSAGHASGLNYCRPKM
jgi:DNA-binding NtrC family response regulator